MDIIWFGLAFVFFILWLAKKPKKTNGNDLIDINSKSYAQGYWDGYRAHQKGLVVDENEAQNIDLTSTQQTITAEVSATNNQQSIADKALQKEKHNMQNINITLYIASFLLVAAAVLFIGTNLPESVRFIGVWFITIAFYSVGLILYDTVEKLRPAAVAFVGTGLALLPFTGIAMYSFILKNDADICWLVTSFLGIIAFILAAMRLKNQVIAYLAIAFGVSLSASSVAILHVGFMWYFVALIAFGSLMTFIAMIKSSWVPECFSKPIQESNNWIVPLTIVASLFAFTEMSLMDYWIISLLCAIYYGGVAASSVKGRDLALFLTRLMASLTVALMVYDMTDSWTSLGIAVSVIGVVQVIISAIFVPKRVIGDNNEVWLWLGFILQLFASLLIFPDQHLHWELIIAGQLMILLVTSFGLSYILRRIIVSIFGTIALAILPIIWGLNIVSPALEMKWLALIFIGFATISMIFRSLLGHIKFHPVVRMFFVANISLFILEALIFTINVSTGWKLGIWISASVLLYWFVYLERQPWLVIIANISFITSSFWLVKLLEVETEWMALVISWIAFATFYLAYWIFEEFSKKTYGIYFWWSAVAVGGLVNLFSLVSTNESIVNIAASGTIVISFVLVIEGWITRKYLYYIGAAILANIGIQRILGLAVPDINILVYTHWWAVVFAGLSYLYYSAGKKMEAKPLLYIALVIMSLFTGMAALGAFGVSDIQYQTIFLVEHVLLLIVGLILSRRLFAIWGAVGAILSVLWTMKNQTYLLLASAAVVLIGVAVYSLIKKSKSIK